MLIPSNENVVWDILPYVAGTRDTGQIHGRESRSRHTSCNDVDFLSSTKESKEAKFFRGALEFIHSTFDLAAVFFAFSGKPLEFNEVVAALMSVSGLFQHCLLKDLVPCSTLQSNATSLELAHISYRCNAGSHGRTR